MDEAPRQRRDDDFHPEQLMHELEDFLRQGRDRGAEGRPVIRKYWESPLRSFIRQAICLIQAPTYQTQ